MSSFSRGDLPTAFGSSKFKSQKRCRGPDNGGDAIDSVDSLFSKRFDFNREMGEFVLPDACVVFASDCWKSRHLQVLKNGLNFQKSRLNDYSIEEWSAHTARRNPAGDVRWKVKNYVNPEFLTQAWTKFYECASNYDLIPDGAVEVNELNTLHLCEAPGAFIASLNHYIKLNHPEMKWKWTATTLNPYHENNCLSNMICDDRLILHTLENWDFGLDFTGNLMNVKNSLNLVERVKANGKVHLITADGSIDCMLNPDEQEECVAALHFCEVITALMALAEGGTLLFKLFTIFEHSTINLLYVLMVCFDKMSIFKPATSKGGNSEVYAVCCSYRGRRVIEPYLDIFMKFYGSEHFNSKAMFPLESLPHSFLDQIQSCAFYFYNLQCEVIHNNIMTYEKPHLRRENILKKYRYIVSQTFLEKYNLGPIKREDEILNGITHEERYIHLNPRNHHGTYSERLRLIPISTNEQINRFRDELKTLQVTYNLTSHDCICWIPSSSLPSAQLLLTYGEPVSKVHSSKFVHSWILKLHIKLMEQFPKLVIEEIYNLPCIEMNFIEVSFKVSPKDSFDSWEKNNLTLLKYTLETMNEGQTLLLKNYNCLTQFSCGVLYTLVQRSFGRIGFCHNCCILLEGFRNKSDILSLLGKIVEELGNCDGGNTILGVVSIQKLAQGDFYSGILEYNNYFMFSYLSQLIEKL